MDDTPINHGKPWISTEIQRVHKLYRDNIPIPEIADIMGRTVAAIEAKLFDPYGERNNLGHKFVPSTITTNRKSKEQTMNVKIEERTFINDNDIADITEDGFIDAIRRVEEAIKKLEAIEHKPIVVVKRIERHKQDIEKLIHLCNKKFPE